MYDIVDPRRGPVTGIENGAAPLCPCCGARNFSLAVRSQDFDRCHSLLLAASAAGGARKRPRFGNPPDATESLYTKAGTIASAGMGPAIPGWTGRGDRRRILWKLLEKDWSS